MSKARFVVYQSFNDFSEVIVTVPELEGETIREYFVNSDREIEEYERSEHADVCIPVRPSGLRIL